MCERINNGTGTINNTDRQTRANHTAHNSTQGLQHTHSKKFKDFSRNFKDLNLQFQVPKLSIKSHTLDVVLQNLDCNVTLNEFLLNKQANEKQVLEKSYK